MNILRSVARVMLLTLLATLALSAEQSAPIPLAEIETASPDLPAVPEATRLVTLGTAVIEVPIEDLGNPLVALQTTAGDIIVELFPREAPTAVANFLGLATGSKPFIDPNTQLETLRPYYDGTIFHRTVDGFIIQGGSPTGLGDGYPGYRFDDEISATSLGLDKMMLIDDSGTPHPYLNLRDAEDFQQRVLKPLYKAMAIADNDQLELRLPEVDRRVRAMTLQEYYEMLGYRYQNALQSRAPLRGMLAMANAGPNSNGSQFFITLVDAPSLTGLNTVFGKVRVGLDVAERIGRSQVDAEHRPLQPTTLLAIQRL